MIEIVTGDMLAAEVEALVNPVNCAGVMGKGLSFAFKQRFPSAFSVIVQRPADRSALQLSCPPEAVTRTVPLRRAPDGLTTSKTTSTPCPGCDGSGVSEMIRVAVSALLTVTGAEVTEVKPDAAKLSRCMPTAPMMPRSVKVARPLASVVRKVVPKREPPPLATSALISTPAAATALPAASRTWTTGCRLNVVPTSAFAGGWVAMPRVEGEPAIEVASKRTVPTPDTEASTDCSPVRAPSVHAVEARPLPSVGLVRGVTDPAPVSTRQLTVTPGTGLSASSTTTTTSGLASWGRA